jgi:hypothetical protein
MLHHSSAPCEITPLALFQLGLFSTFEIRVTAYVCETDRFPNNKSVLASKNTDKYHKVLKWADLLLSRVFR